MGLFTTPSIFPLVEMPAGTCHEKEIAKPPQP